MIADAERDPALADLLRDAGRTVTGLSAAHLGLTGSVTLARLKTLMAGFGLTSPGRVRALLSHMLHLRYVEPDPAAAGSRSAQYRLTARFLASYLEHERSLVAAAAVVEPAAGLVLDHLDRPEVLATLVAEQTQSFILGSRQPNPHEDWYAVFMHRHAGIQILHALMAASPDFPPTEDFPFQVAAMARRFKVSRMHVARMLNDAEEGGFLTSEAGGLRFTASGCEALHWIYAGRLCVHLRAIARTTAALRLA
ncbi:MAG: hypothetical protein JSR98_04880 [Proteobacteria bacterium]|nr:hypothetical protein [Pseudomonadota bacterium]